MRGYICIVENFSVRDSLCTIDVYANANVSIRAYEKYKWIHGYFDGD